MLFLIGKLVCDSNIGNLSLHFKKFDKSILHLLKSIKLRENHNTTNDIEELFSGIKEIIERENNNRNSYAKQKLSQRNSSSI